MTEKELERVKSYLFVLGGLFAGSLGAWFSQRGFGFNLPEISWVGWGLSGLCIILQIAFSSQLQYGSYNYVIFLSGIMAYIYSGWSNYTGIMDIGPSANHAFAFILGEIIDWVAEPLIVFGLIGAVNSAQGDFIRNLLGMRPEESKQPSPTSLHQKVNRPVPQSVHEVLNRGLPKPMLNQNYPKNSTYHPLQNKRK